MFIKYLNYIFLFLWLKYSLSQYSRYRFIYDIILKLKPKTILEIGVYKGKRSKEMIHLAKSFNKKIFYYGFDLFEDIKKSKINIELSKKPKSKKYLKKFISQNAKNVHVDLIKGDTKKTLKSFSKKNIKIDFVFIDGGHAVSTIKSDWKYIKKIIGKKSVVVFDDYYDNSVITRKFGCNKVIKNLENKYKYTILPSTDYVTERKMSFKNSLVKVSYK
jgi:hypothetical protein